MQKGDARLHPRGSRQGHANIVDCSNMGPTRGLAVGVSRGEQAGTSSTEVGRVQSTKVKGVHLAK